MITGNGDHDEMAQSSLFKSLPSLLLLWYPHRSEMQVSPTQCSWQESLQTGICNSHLYQLIEDQMSPDIPGQGMPKPSGGKYIFVTSEKFQECKK